MSLRQNIKLDAKKLPFFRFKRLNGLYLITNDFGGYVFLKPEQFKQFIEGKLSKGKVYERLADKGFIKDKLDWAKSVMRYQQSHSSLLQGTSLHIIVVTLRCDSYCVYCQSSSKPLTSGGNYDMSRETAQKTVDFIFQSPSPAITIEFQGGEPLVNWPVVKFIVEYARKKQSETKKKLFIGLVSNFNLITDSRLDFLIKNYVGLCTSLDGPEFLHNANRPCPTGNSYKITTEWIRKIHKIEKEREKTNHQIYKLSALLTVSRKSLQYPREIIDEYLKWGFTGIHLRSLSYLGLAQKEMGKIGYTTEEFLDFWRKAMDYIIDLNLKGNLFFERGATIVLKKILRGEDPGYVDLKSPCGAAVGQMLYNYDGKIYTCDEGRMCGDESFVIGDIKNHSKPRRLKESTFYNKVVSGDKVKTMLVSSVLDNSPCDYCVYKSYCGVCPVLNYAIYGNLFPQIYNTDWCKRNRGIFEYLFERLKNKKIAEVFERWAKMKF